MTIHHIKVIKNQKKTKNSNKILLYILILYVLVVITCHVTALANTIGHNATESILDYYGPKIVFSYTNWTLILHSISMLINMLIIYFVFLEKNLENIYAYFTIYIVLYLFIIIGMVILHFTNDSKVPVQTIDIVLNEGGYVPIVLLSFISGNIYAKIKKLKTNILLAISLLISLVFGFNTFLAFSYNMGLNI